MGDRRQKRIKDEHCESTHFGCFDYHSSPALGSSRKAFRLTSNFSMHLNWQSNKNWHVAEPRARTNKKCIKIRRSRLQCAWRTFKKRWHENTSCLFGRTHLAIQQRQYIYRVCDAKIVHSSLCDALFHHRNAIANQIEWKIICRVFFSSFILRSVPMPPPLQQPRCDARNAATCDTQALSLTRGTQSH